MNTKFFLVLFYALVVSCSPKILHKNQLSATPLTAQDLLKWKFYGMGDITASPFGDGIILKESAQTKGIILISPDVYDDVTLRYKVVALNPATVLVNFLALANKDEKTLNIPEGYDGGINIWNDEKPGYFIAFRNAPHQELPFLKKKPRGKLLAKSRYLQMNTGVTYAIETGKINNKIWLKINNKIIFNFKDDSSSKSGKIAFRIRRLNGFPAACLVHDVSIIKTLAS